MDADEALKRIREKVVAVLISRDNETLLNDEAGELAELVEGLDTWITKGGFLPAEWQRKAPSQGKEP